MISVLEYLEQTAGCVPEKTAFADESDRISFGELLTAAKRAGSALLPFDCFRKPVALLMEKSVRTVQLMMGTLYAGGFYVMLDTAQPAERLNRILETLQPEVLLTRPETKEMADQLAFNGRVLTDEELLRNGHAVAEDDGSESRSRNFIGTKMIDEEGLARIRRAAKDTDPVYVLFTSGSSGIPKGVVVSHRSVIDFIDQFTEIFGITREDVLGNQAPFDFDVSVKDIYSGLKTGAEVELIPRRLFSFPALLLDFLEERQVTNLTWAVSALVIVSMLDGLDYKRPSKIRRIMFSGETMPVRHLNYWRKYYPQARFVNLYGPTEITCNCSYFEIDRPFEVGDVIPIGRSFPNETVFLLDEENRLVTEEGITGEICVSGTALALGYFRNPEQTEKAFVQNPLNDRYPERIYRTGDLGVFNSRGELCFASRKDFQIKHMGHRIELGEIEAAMERVEAVRRCCCVFLEEKSRIVCFYQGEIDVKELSCALQTWLPEYMIPNVFEKMEALPVTKNGKIDRAALKEKAALRRRRRARPAEKTES